MWSGTGGRAPGVPRHGVYRWSALAVGLALAGAGCTTDGGAGSVSAMPTAMPGPAGAGTVAFESIDGPPVAVFQKLVVDLGDAAQARQLQVVSREGQASYRVRGFLAIHVERGQSHVGWVWDVYDADRRRALRIAGEETSPRRGADAWASADDQMLRRIARQAVDRIAALLDAPQAAPPPEPAAPVTGRPAVAAAEPRAPAAIVLAGSRP